MKTNGWKTLSIPITEAVIKDGKVVSFKYKGEWYGDDKPATLVDKGIDGSIDLGSGAATFTAKHQSTTDAVIATYVVTGKVKK